MASVERRGDDLLKVNMLKRIKENGIADNYVTLYDINPEALALIVKLLELLLVLEDHLEVEDRLFAAYDFYENRNLHHHV